MPSHFKFIATFFVIVSWVLTALGPVGVTPVYAAGLVVNGNADTVANDGVCTLREAIVNANNDNQSGSTDCAAGSGTDTITFAGNYSITLTSALPQLTGNLTLDGSGHNVSVSGNHAVGVFVVQSGAVVTMSQLSIVNGTTGVGGGIYNHGTVLVTHSTLSGNSSTGAGGGIGNTGALTVINSTFSGNSSGNAGGGIYNTAGTLTVINSTFSGNSAATYGGGIRNNFGTLTVTHSTISGNSAASFGGGIASAAGALYLRNSLIANSSSGGDCLNQDTFAANVNNLIEDGSCGPALSGDPHLSPLGSYGGSTPTFALLPGSPAIDAAGDCTPYLNPDEDQRGVARPQGSACDIGAYEAKEQLGPNFVVNLGDDSDDGSCDWVGALDCTLREAINAANNQSGANAITFAANYTITLASALPNLAGTLTIDGSGRSITVSGNSAVGVFVIQPTAVVTMRQLSIINGLEVNFGGIYNFGTLVVENSIFSGNQASAGGGGIRNAGTLTISNSTFSGNTAFNGGGGIRNAGALTITNSTFSDNSAPNNNGGGIDNPQGTLTIANSTFSGNSAGGYGGGIANSGTLTVTNSTFSGNSVNGGSGGGIASDGTLHLQNSLIANSPNGGDCQNFGTIATNANNLIEDGSCSPALSGDPNLGPLANNGGSTQTFALLPGSPAIDAGDDATCAAAPVNNLDQRGIARPQGAHCDIGAFESRGFTLTKIGGDNQSTLVQTTFPNPLAISVTSAAGEPVNGGQVILIAPASGAGLMTTPITLTIANGAVSTTVTANGTAGSYNVVASAAGAANVAFNLTNNLASTTTSLTSTPNPSVYGQAITVTAAVTTSAVGLGTPIGSITFTIDSLSVNVPLDANGQVVYVTTTLSAGHHPITATYSGDADHSGSTSNTIDQVVNPADTTTTIASALNPSIVGQAVTFTATVASTVDTPLGTVQFYADGAALGSSVALSYGQASLSTSTLTVGTHSITATYSGDANHNGSTSNTIDQVVNPADTTTAIASALNPSIVGQAVTFTATVTSTVDTPSGSVQFYADGSALGSPVTLSNSQASLSTSVLAVGTHPITATYSGDANHHGGTSNQVDQVVNQAKMYLPLISHNFVNAPDLIVQSLTANANTVQVVIKNQGTAPVVDEFWVDVYVNPISTPTAVNQTWQMLGHQGLVWGVTANALPALTPGGVLTLTVNDAHFFADLSAVAWPLAAGTALYAQVDAANTATTYGAVLETHEVRGEPYNNIFGPVSSSALALNFTSLPASPASAALPQRPH